MSGPARSADRARQVATVIGAVAQAALPALLLPRIRRDLQPPEVAQPAPWAFAIWVPVYATSAVHAARQARPALSTDPLLRDVGWPLAAAYLCIGAWAPLLYRQRYWAAQSALAGAAVLAGTGRARVTAAPSADVPLSLALGTGLLSGWCAAACGVNLASMLVGSGPVPAQRSDTLGTATALALGGIGTATLSAGATGPTERVYGATLVWALVGVADGRRRTSPQVAAAALVVTIPILRRLVPGAR